MIKSKKINNIILIIPSLSGGGAERTAANLACLFKDNGFSVEIICIYKKSLKEFKINKDIKVTYLNCKRSLYSIKKLKNILINRNPSFIITFLSLTNILISVAKFFTKIKHFYIYTQHEIPSKTFNQIFKINRNILIKFLIKISYKSSDKIICVSNGLKEEMKKLFNNNLDSKITTIYNYIENSKIHNKEFRSNNSEINLLSIGRLVDHKDFFTLLKSINLIKDKVKFKLTIIGKGNQENRLKKYIKDNKLNKFCKIIPFTENLSRYYTKSDIYISTSLHESFGNTIVEAMQYGLKIISTNCPYGPSEILNKGEYGKLINMRSPNELADSIIEISRTKKVPNYKKVLNKFQEKSILNQYKKVFKELSNNKF